MTRSAPAIAVRAAYEAHREVSAAATTATRRVWPAAAGFWPVKEEGETIGYGQAPSMPSTPG